MFHALAHAQRINVVGTSGSGKSTFTRTVWRVTKRTFTRSLTRQEIWPGSGNRESLRKAFLSRDSIIWWAVTNWCRNRSKYTALIAAPEHSHIHFLRLTSPRMVAACLQEIENHLQQSSTDTSVTPM